MPNCLRSFASEPGKFNWATATGISDFLFSSFLKNAKLEMSKVPYRDTVQPANDLAEGRIQIYWGALAIVRPHLQTGKAKLLAVSNSMQVPDDPNVPTVAEAGFRNCVQRTGGTVRAARDAGDLRERIADDIKAVAGDAFIGRAW